MAKLPTVAIIGRPNTGKSTLFNRLVGRRKAIVSDVPGTTRDQIAHRIETDQVDYLLVDTGGMGGGTDDIDFEDDVHAQSLLALEHADLIVLTLNSREDLTRNDFEIADLLRKRRRKHVPILVVLTKCDELSTIDELLPNYYELGLTDHIIPISAVHKIGMDDLEDAIEQHLADMHFGKSVADEQDIPKIAIIGRPNVGKSSIVNAFMSDTQRSKSPLLVSDVPGTTRDSVDTIIRYNEQEYLFVDTAGVRRRKQTTEGIETHAYFRTIRALEQADVCVLVLDATQGLSRQDKRIAGLAVESGKGLIILINKIDVASKQEREYIMQMIEYDLQFCKFAPLLPCSAQTREGLLKVFPLIEQVARNRDRRIPDKDLRRWFEDAIHNQPMGAVGSTKHITQADDIPPTFVLFVRDPKQVQVSQLRYLENSLRRTFALEGTPVRWITKGRHLRD